MRKLFITFDEKIIDDKIYNVDRFKSSIKGFLKNRIRKYSTQLNVGFVYNYSEDIENMCGCFKIDKNNIAYIYIIINNCEKSDDVVEKIIYVLLHEIGHFIDFNSKYLKSDGLRTQYELFYDEYLKEKENITKKFKNYDELYSYWKNNPDEIFANNYSIRNYSNFCSY